MSERWKLEVCEPGTTKWSGTVTLPGENTPLAVREILLPLLHKYSAVRAVRPGEEVRVTHRYGLYARHVPAEVLAP